MTDNNMAEQSPETQPGMDIVMPTEPTEDPVVTHERAAFQRYVQDQGEAIPPNFKNAEDWFNSLKEAQSQYTRGQQEIADLKQNYSETGVLMTRRLKDNPRWRHHRNRHSLTFPICLTN